MNGRSGTVSIHSHRETKPRRNGRDVGQVVLVLQGGGALGGYQAGVYQALHERGLEPDWVIGTSIGAINAAIIAGNAPERRLERLQAFWSRMQREPIGAGLFWPGGANFLDIWRTMTGGIPGFFQPNWLAFLSPHLSLGTQAAGFYSVTALDETLTEFVDF
jgi:NTE family protein